MQIRVFLEEPHLHCSQFGQWFYKPYFDMKKSVCKSKFEKKEALAIDSVGRR